MTAAEIVQTWEELSQCEAYEAFSVARLDYDQVEAILGAEVASGYTEWTYFNIK